jgi:hypothetical protein
MTLKAIKRLKPSKSVGAGDIPGFIIKEFTDIFVSALKHSFNRSLSQQHFPALWKQAAIASVRKKKKATVPLLAITDQYLLSIIFPNYLNLLFMTMFRIV